MSKVSELADLYAKAVQDKKQLEAQLEDVKKIASRYKEALVDAMLEEETTSIGRNGKKFTLVQKTKYSKRGGMDEALFEMLREQSMGDIITETVNANTLNAALHNVAAENGGELPEEWNGCVNSYEYTDIRMTKG